MKLSDRILLFLAQHKYISKSLCVYEFPLFSKSHIEKTLKRLVDQSFAIRKMIESEPIQDTREYVYYLTNKGAKKVLHVSDLFADTEEMNLGTGNAQLIFHDLSVAWITSLWQRQSSEYQNAFFDNIQIESRRNFLKIKDAIPDLLITTIKDEVQKKYFIEVDNFTVQTKDWRKKFINYEDVLASKNNYLLIVTTKYNTKRVSKLIKIAESSNTKQVIFASSLEEIYKCCYLANIWTTLKNNHSVHLPI